MCPTASADWSNTNLIVDSTHSKSPILTDKFSTVCQPFRDEEKDKSCTSLGNSTRNVMVSLQRRYSWVHQKPGSLVRTGVGSLNCVNDSINFCCKYTSRICKLQSYANTIGYKKCRHWSTNWSADITFTQAYFEELSIKYSIERDE